MQTVKAITPDRTEATMSTTQHYIFGNTFSVKSELAAMGCRYDGQRKGWYTMDAAVFARASALVANAPKSTFAPKSIRPAMPGGGERKRCWECGAYLTAAQMREGGGDFRDSYCGC